MLSDNLLDLIRAYYGQVTKNVSCLTNGKLTFPQLPNAGEAFRFIRLEEDWQCP